MIKNIYLSLLCTLCLALVSCNDWLDVRQDLEQKEEDTFKKERGFRNALTGCYMAMADRGAYGEKLTMTNIESLANLWQMPDPATTSFNKQKTDYYLRTYQYDKEETQDAIKTIYAKLFNVITQANAIIINAEDHKGVFTEEKHYDIVLGEAYAIRALCQMDILRLFGQMPQNATRQVSLPYSESASLSVMPPYYNFNDYVSKLKSDLQTAESLLKDSDPVSGTTFDAASSDDDFFLNRRFRLNYWAVKALQARLCLYLGETGKAHDTAMQIINAKPLELSGSSDLAGNNLFLTCPSEALFMLSKYNLIDYSIELFSDANTSSGTLGNVYLITTEQLNQLYNGVETSSHNRYIRCWNKSVTDAYGIVHVALKKYWYNASDLNSNQSEALMTKLQVIPMIRMSEIYLIAIETSNDLAEVNSLYKTYMRSHDVMLTNNVFTTLDAARDEVINEYRREFFGEGLMFYVYKRKGMKKQMFNSSEVTEEDYEIPLPATEYDPSAVK